MAPVSGPYSTYEIFIDVRGHRRHNEYNQRKDRTCDKLAGTNNPDQMISDVLRDFGAKISPSLDDHKSETDIFRALDHARKNNIGERDIRIALNEVAKYLHMEWYGVID